MRMLIALVAASLLAVFIYIGNSVFWFDREVLTSENFVASTVTALEVESSRDAMGQMIADRLVDELPLLILIESNLVGVFSELVGSPALDEVITLVAVDLHGRMISDNQNAITINLAEYRGTIIAPLQVISPQLAELVPAAWFASVEILEAGALPDLPPYVQWIDFVKKLSVIMVALLVVALVLLVRRRSVLAMLVGAALAVAGLGTSVLVPGGRWLAVMVVEGERVGPIVANVYDELTTSLLVSVGILAVAGAGLIALGAVMWSVERETRGSERRT